MRAVRALLLIVALAPCAALAEKSVEVRLGEWRASYTTWDSPSDVCDAQAQWLADELHSVNQLLDAFLAKGTTRNGAWKEDDLPLLEQAAKVLPAMVDAQEATLRALEKCELRRTGLFPKLLERGLALVKEAHSEVGRLPELVRFARHRVALERWEKDRLDRATKARESCNGASSADRIYFAWEDEFGARHWLFCDDGAVLAPPGKAWEHQPPEGKARDPKHATMCIQAARLFPEKDLARAPKP